MASLGLAAYAGYFLLGDPALLRMLIWFAGAAVVHDLVLFPAYSAADRALVVAARGHVPLINHIRVPALGACLALLLFWPGIVRQGEATHLAATGLDQSPYLGRWLGLTAVLFGLSGVVFLVRVATAGPSTTAARAPGGGGGGSAGNRAVGARPRRRGRPDGDRKSPMIASCGAKRALVHVLRSFRRSPAGPPVRAVSRAPQRATLASGARADVLAIAGVVGLVAAAAIVGRRLLAEGFHLFLPFPPLAAEWMPHVGPGTPAAVVVAVAVVTRGPALAERLSWRPLLGLAWVASIAWTTALALVDGWQRGVAGRLTTTDEYLHDVPRAPGPAVLLREFADHILTSAVDPGQTWFWTTHVGAHPPGVFLLFVLLDRVGLGGGGPAALLVVLVGASAGVAVAVTARALGDEPLARRALPYTVLFPGAVWVGVSADGLFAGWLAWGVALLAVGVAARGRRRDLAAAAGGLLLGSTVYLSYGLVLGGLLALAVVVAGLRRRPLTHTARSSHTLREVCVGEGRCVSGGSGRATLRAPVIAGVSALVVVAAFTAAGFSWLDGYAKVQVIYAASAAAARPYPYFVWANLAAVAFAMGPAAVAGLRRLFATAVAARPADAVADRLAGAVAEGRRSIARPQLIVVAALAAILLADLSGMSKAEVERIWLPFAVWTALACADLPHPRRWLAAQAVAALLVNHLLLTFW